MVLYNSIIQYHIILPNQILYHTVPYGMIAYRGGIADGIGTPDPNPKHLLNWCL